MECSEYILWITLNGTDLDDDFDDMEPNRISSLLKCVQSLSIAVLSIAGGFLLLLLLLVALVTALCCLAHKVKTLNR